ncbi:MAG: TPM domain-containing protein [Actinobacteria bacterium]|nr:TPM domain-containing protein [Actinomycetota bacterium]
MPGPRSPQPSLRQPRRPASVLAFDRDFLLSLAALVMALFFLLLLPARAGAEEPYRLASQVEDRAGVLGVRQAEVQAAVRTLQDAERVQLWVAYVDSFSGLAAQDWADATATKSDLGLRDVLLAVAAGDRAYAYSVDQDFPLTQAELEEVMTVAVEPALSGNDWAGAAIGAATGLGQALRGEAVTPAAIQPGPPYEPPTEPQPAEGGSSAFVWLLVLLIVVAVVMLVIWLLVRRARSRPSSGTGAPGAAGVDALSLEELRRRANAELVETDDAVKTSTQELGFAVAEFGEEQAAPFSQALAEAQHELDQAFQLRKELDGAAGEGPQRELLTAILQHTSTANAALDAQAERFDKLRDLERNAPEVLTKLERQLAELEVRRPQAVRVLTELAKEYAAAALAPVAAAPTEAASRMDFAREHVKAGREDLAAGHRGEAAVEALVAEEAAGQAQQLVDSVERLRRDLAGAQALIDEAVAETRRDIAEATASAGAQLQPLVAIAEAAVTAAAAAAALEGGRDPLAALRRLREADGVLEQALVQVRDEQTRRAKAAESLERTLIAARSVVASAGDYITTHRGAVGSGPRTLLSEAQRHLDQAVALGGSDPVTAVQHAAQAQESASRAFNEARAEAEPAVAAQRARGGGGGGMGGAILGGILVNAMSGRGGGGGSSGGRRSGGGSSGGRRSGGGGFSSPSFGGGGTRMRRGGGGRF